MFRKQSVRLSAGASAPFQKVFVADEFGLVSEKMQNTAAELPPVENFRLDALLKAGVDLKEMNTKVVGSTDTLPVLPEETETETETDEA